MNGVGKSVLLTVPKRSTALPGPNVHLMKGPAAAKDLWRLDSLLATPDHTRIGCLARLHLFEENARFALLGVLLIGYLLFGACIFQLIERENEQVEKQNYVDNLQLFRDKYCAIVAKTTDSGSGEDGRRINCSDFETELALLLHLRGNLSAAGLMYPRAKWNFAGAFYFVGTVISTIGFGMTTPRTATGRVVTIVYGFVGCASCILFFNLFLERIVTALAYFLRVVHNIKERYRTRKAGESAARAAISIALRAEFDDISATTNIDTAPWRPSLYKVFTCLLLFALAWTAAAAAVYASIEKRWTYFDAVYFCFVSFATIGFGDFVSSQQSDHVEGMPAYRVANFVFLSVGCCCIYSLFNVTSVVVRQCLNRLIKKLDCSCKRPRCLKKKHTRYMGMGLRPPDPDSDDSDSTVLPPDGVVSLKEFLEHNTASFLAMQRKIILASSNKKVSALHDESTQISANSVGPLAILSKKFGQEDT